MIEISLGGVNIFSQASSDIPTLSSQDYKPIKYIRQKKSFENP